MLMTLEYMCMYEDTQCRAFPIDRNLHMLEDRINATSEQVVSIKNTCKLC